MANTIGSCAGLVASNVYLTQERPYYRTGYGVALASILLTAVCAIIMLVLMQRENQKRDAGKRDTRLDATPEQLANMGDYHPAFRFTL